jgi:CHAD domain-containing protein
MRRRYKKRLARCKRDFSERAVHDLRVQTRRMLALVELAGKLSPARPGRKLARSFEKRLKMFGHLRDVHVQQQLLEPLWPRFPGANRLKGFLDRREQKLVARLTRDVSLLESARLDRRLRKLEKALDAKSRKISVAEMKTQMARVLNGSFREVSVLRRRVHSHQPATIHSLRVAFKRYRYLRELIGPLLDDAKRRSVDQMKRFQQSAGRVQDLRVLLAAMARLVRHRKISPVNLRALRHELQRQQAAAAASFVERLSDLDEFKPGAGRRNLSHK